MMSSEQQNYSVHTSNVCGPFQRSQSCMSCKTHPMYAILYIPYSTSQSHVGQAVIPSIVPAKNLSLGLDTSCPALPGSGIQRIGFTRASLVSSVTLDHTGEKLKSSNRQSPNSSCTVHATSILPNGFNWRGTRSLFGQWTGTTWRL